MKAWDKTNRGETAFFFSLIHFGDTGHVWGPANEFWSILSTCKETLNVPWNWCVCCVNVWKREDKNNWLKFSFRLINRNIVPLRNSVVTVLSAFYQSLGHFASYIFSSLPLSLPLFLDPSQSLSEGNEDHLQPSCPPDIWRWAEKNRNTQSLYAKVLQRKKKKL